MRRISNADIYKPVYQQKEHVRVAFLESDGLRQGKAEESKGEEKPRFVLSFCTPHKRLCKPMGVDTLYLPISYVHERTCAEQKREFHAVRPISNALLYDKHAFPTIWLCQDSRQTAHWAVCPSLF